MLQDALFATPLLIHESQCALPVFEGLLDPSHDNIVRVLLFELVTWHALAKLHLHTETTICGLEHSTKRLGQVIRTFESQTCSQFQTRDLPSEDAAQCRNYIRLIM